uniref:DUF547 domain-containing protein n=1 Tax=Marinobacter nauticus TaxID=2743 RepID=A0A455VZU8_MARNT|nr:DUF547 domain-containing protein [Marinobacter nauticus]
MADANPSVYSEYQNLLKKYLVERSTPGNGLVSGFNYREALADAGLEQALRNQREILETFDPATLVDRKESVAFWVNAYNFFMLNQILTERPNGQLISSVWDYGGRYSPFSENVFQRRIFDVGGQLFSLDDIEKGILLGDVYKSRGWKDARVHFAVNCASVGCPPLRGSIYTAGNLERLLEENTRRALSTDQHLRASDGILYVTELFKWYEQDYIEAEGSVKAFILRWATNDVAERVAETSNIRYISYDWALNDLPSLTISNAHGNE